MSDEERLQEVFAELGGADNARKEIFDARMVMVEARFNPSP